MKFKKLIKESVEPITRCDSLTETTVKDSTEESTIVKHDSDYHVKKYGAWWFGIVGPDNLLLRDNDNELRLFKTKDAAQEFIDTECNVLNEASIEKPLSNSEKLKLAYPELNFDLEPDTKEVVTEELTNMQKLIARYPELAEEPSEVITEGVGADILNKFRELLDNVQGRNEFVNTVTKVVDVIPDNFMDDLYDLTEQKLNNVHVDSKTEETIASAAGITKEETPDTLNQIFDFIDKRELMEENPELTKTFLITTLKAVGAVEPSPVVEIIVSILSMLPANVVTKIATLMQSTNPIVIATSKARKYLNKKKSKVAEEYNTDTFEYDDDYDIDDVEEDRIHAALYGGDLTYCKYCGERLKRNEWGGYCPTCDSEEENIQ